MVRVKRSDDQTSEKVMTPVGFEPTPLTRWQLECHVLDRSTKVSLPIEIAAFIYSITYPAILAIFAETFAN